jgi:benzoyl-CoA reductase/2-hydroxyglutaryl-CoA dehydratase subunit BcrC/BadD/HgdB
MIPTTDRRIGITSTVPIEIIYAADLIPVDLNNVFAASPCAADWVDSAEARGFPRNCCSWIKGIYTAAHELGIPRMIAVTQGDCAQTHALMEVLADDGVEAIPFSYPDARTPKAMGDAIRLLAARLEADFGAVAEMKCRLDRTRRVAHAIDRATHENGTVSGWENSLALVGCSDMEGEPGAFRARLEAQLADALSRPPRSDGLRLGLLGVPPISADLHSAIEEAGARVVFNEIPRQFAMPYPTESLAEQYTRYTYPYGMAARLEDIRREIDRRRLSGVIHYVQSFCFRQIGDVLLRRHVPCPILTLEGDRPGPVDGAIRIRIETFVEMLSSC